MTENTEVTPQDEEWPGWKLTPGEYKATVEKVAKINARAERRGFTGRIGVEAERVEETTTNDFGFTVTEVFYQTKITGDAPKYDGWQLLATLDFDREAGLIVRTAPGVEKIDRTGLREGYCDHCKKTRMRSKVYLVGNDKGEQVQVGSSCIKDFLGWKASVVFIDTDHVREEVEESRVGATYWDRSWDVDSILAIAWAAIQVYGYVGSRGFGESTKDVVAKVLDPRGKFDREEAAKIQPYVEQSYPQARIIRDWVLSDEFKGDSEYVTNLKAIAGAEHATGRNLGFLCSAPQTWAKAQERDLIRRKEKAEIANEWVGKEKDRIEVTVTIKSIRYFDSQWGTTCLYTLVSDDHHVFKWFASSRVLGNTTDGRVFKIKGTVKKHDEYNGLKSTVLTRCKLLDGDPVIEHDPSWDDAQRRW